MKVWVVEECVPYEQGRFIGVYATEELAKEAAARELYQDYMVFWAEEVVTELPPREPSKSPYQVIP